MRAVIAVATFLMLQGCTTYEYEEEFYLEVDGSGRLRVSGSETILESLYATDASTPEWRSRFEGRGVEIESVRETERNGRRFVHLEGAFDDWNAICELPAFSGRACELDVGSDELLLYLTLPGRRAAPSGVASDALIALRFHFPSTVRYHNSATGIERGNIIEWERTVSQYFDADDIVVEANFERRSILATTLGVLGAAVGIVVLSVVAALYWMVRKGRRQLELEAKAPRRATPPA